jgi:hypothetical protein
LPATLADRAWQLGEGGKRVTVYCQRRAAAQQVRDKIDEARRDGLAGVTELVVGARRVLVPMPNRMTVAVPGPLLLGAGSHFGNGLFTAQA